MRFCLRVLVAMLLVSLILAAETPAGSGQTQRPGSTASGGASMSSGPYPSMSTAARNRVRQIFEMYEKGQTGALWATFADGLKKQSGSEERFAEYTKKLREKTGSETKVLQEVIGPIMLAPGTSYSRLSRFSQVSVPVMTSIAIDEHGVVEAFTVAPEPQPPQGRYAGYEATADLRLPFNGEWFVAQGGQSMFDNGYMGTDDQRFAYDFVLVKGGRLYSGDPTQLQSFYCYGQPVLAPADGTVVRLETGYVDNPPGRPSGDSPQGNVIVLKHSDKEYTMLSHLQQASAKVKKGDTVKQGQEIAACGNSGSSPAPHVHIQFQNTAGLPPPEQLQAKFNNYMADGKLVALGIPRKGQLVSNAPLPPSTPASAAAPAGTQPPPQKTPPAGK